MICKRKPPSLVLFLSSLLFVLVVFGIIHRILLTIFFLTILLSVFLLLLLHVVGSGGCLHLLWVELFAVVSLLVLVGILLRASRNLVRVLFQEKSY